MNLVDANVADGAVEFGGFRIPLAPGQRLDDAPRR